MVAQLFSRRGWHRPKHSETLLQGINVCLHRRALWSVRFWNTAEPEIEHRSAVLPGRWTARSRTRWRPGSDKSWGKRRGDCLSVRAAWRVAGTNFLLQRRESWERPFLPLPTSTDWLQWAKQLQAGNWATTPSPAPMRPAGASLPPPSSPWKLEQ